MTRIPHRLALLLLPLVLAACQPTYGDPYGSYGGVYSDRIYADSLYDGRYGGQDRVFRSRAERDAYVYRMRQLQARADLSDLQRARREALLQREYDRRRHAGRDYQRGERRLDQAERELERARWRDRRPVRTGRYDRADAERREAAFEARRAQNRQERAARQLERQQVQLQRQQQAVNAQERIDRINRVQARQQARQEMARNRAADDAERRQNGQRGLSARDRMRMDQSK